MSEEWHVKVWKCRVQDLERYWLFWLRSSQELSVLRQSILQEARRKINTDRAKVVAHDEERGSPKYGWITVPWSGEDRTLSWHHDTPQAFAEIRNPSPGMSSHETCPTRATFDTERSWRCTGVTMRLVSSAQPPPTSLPLRPSFRWRPSDYPTSRRRRRVQVRWNPTIQRDHSARQVCDVMSLNVMLNVVRKGV